MQQPPPTPPFSPARIPENEPVRFDIESANITYPGQVVRAAAWNRALGEGVPSDISFRIVLLSQRGKPSDTPQPADPRVVVCLPDSLAKVAEAQAGYATSPPPFPEPRRFVKGVVVGSSGRTRDDVAVFNKENWADALQHLAERIVAPTASPLPFDLGGLTSAVTPNDMALLWRGLAQGERTPDVLAALNAYAPAFGLASRDEPGRLTSSALVVESLIEQTLPQGPAPFADLLVRCASHLSLPPYLATFFLLMSLLRRSGEYQVTLREGHGVRWLNDDPFPGDTLTADYLPSVRWDAALIEDCASMILATDATWPAQRPALSRLVPAEELTADNEVAALRKHSQEATAAREPLIGLLDATNIVDADELSGALDRLLSLLQAETPQAFQEALRYHYPTFADYLSESRKYAGLCAVSEAAEDIAFIPGYLERATLGGGQAELEVGRLAILEQTNVSELVRQPSLLPQLQHQFDLFRSRYRGIYEARHHTHQAEAREIHDALESSEYQAAALRRLNAIHELGPEVGTTALAAYPRLLEMTVPCDIATEEMALDAQPVCPRCGFSLSDTSPDEEARALLQQVQDALREQYQRISSHTISQILSRSGEDRVLRFLQVVEASDLANLTDVLDDTVAAFLRDLINGAVVEEKGPSVLTELASLYPTVGEEDINKAAGELARLAHEALDRAKQQKPGEPVRIRLW